jgi:serine-type D-Ala-D-Ala carboxypeptidase/endopeptidase (penicillin-binding protein 4)
MLSQLRGSKAKTNWGARAGVLMGPHLLALTCALLLLPAQALAGAKEKLTALAPSGLVLVMDEKGNELVAQNADKPFVPASVAKIVTSWLAIEPTTASRPASTWTAAGCSTFAVAAIPF